ncbi:MAG: hypothetical protein OXE53_07075 [Deltaproteobacteria bacterium]|nr:hypothetical protein [Deltaproteobacteria bacterium]
MADLTELLAYVSGIYFIKPDMESHAFLATLAAIHLCNGVLCFVIARHGGRHQAGWALAGLLLGVWGALPLLLLRRRANGTGADFKPATADATRAATTPPDG